MSIWTVQINIVALAVLAIACAGNPAGPSDGASTKSVIEALRAQAINSVFFYAPIGNVQISWVSSPHFYKSGRVIVTYIGNDGHLQILQKVFRPPFARASPSIRHSSDRFPPADC